MTVVWPPNMRLRPLTRPGTTAPSARRWTPFGASWATTLDDLARELDHLQAKNVILEVDFREQDLRVDGMPRARAFPGSPAVALAFDSKHGPLRYATDIFNDWQSNLRAIALGMQSLRRVDRYGITHASEQYRGFRALPATGDRVQPPVDVLQHYAGADGTTIDPTDKPAIRTLYKRAVRRTHPDFGGNAEDFATVQDARDRLEKAGEF